MPIRIAFVGFRHAHILELYNLAASRADVQVVAAAEDHLPTRQQLAAAGKVRFTHDSSDDLFRQVEFDVLAVGDYYGRRGELLIRGLETGHHVIADKPICTSPSELARIKELSAARRLCVGCQLSLRESGNFRALRNVVRSGRIGPIHTVTFLGQHPLLRASRPGWYFESPAHHGGTINDIAIHAIDGIPWLTGRKIASIVAARVWNGGLTEPDWFQVGAQVMLRLDNGGGVVGDVSYLAPEQCGYAIANYWRFTVHGAAGQAETSATADAVTVCLHSDKAVQTVGPEPPAKGVYLDGLLAEIAGQTDNLPLSTAEVLESSRICLLAQQAAEQNLRDVSC